VLGFPRLSSSLAVPNPRRLAAPVVLALLIGLSWTGLANGAIDRIVAIVEDDVILASELQRKLVAFRQSLAQSNTPMPPEEAVVRQVLERLILEKIQLHLAEKLGIRVDDETLRLAVQQIAQRNNMTPEDLRSSLRQEGIDYGEFIEQIRGEIAIQRLRSSQVGSQIKISDREVQLWLERQGQSGRDPSTDYLLGHILIATPQAASPSAVQKAREKADRLMEELKKGLDFKQASLSSSDSDQALTGGELGWRKLGQIPSLFADMVPGLKEGDLAGPIRSPSGFHIVKLLGIKGAGAEKLTKTHVRHILLKTNEVVSDDDASKKLAALKQRIEGGEDFGVLARAHSDDKGSAVKAGDLGFVTPGSLVSEFEEAMNRLQPNQLSDPVQTQFGWHLIQVLERQESADTGELRDKQARDELRKRKEEEETELWLRRIRDEAYVEIRLQDAQSDPPLPAADK
jgi:peptidyl-prolyl cis-trans isomerase SurA